MIDQDKIILMSKIELYKKKHLRRDQRITDYFVEDYIYINNFKTRLGISLITLIFMGLGAFRILYQNIIVPNSLKEVIDVYVSPYFGEWVLAIIVGTIISSLVYGVRYRKASERMNAYKRMVHQLETYGKQREIKEGATNEI